MAEVTASPARATVSRPQLAGALAALGIDAGDDVLVHSSLRAFGLVQDGPTGVLHAIRQVIGTAGTIVVPTQTANNSVTSRLFLAAVKDRDAAGCAEFEARIEGFDPAVTPSVRMGRFAEYLRCQPGAVRSCHPQSSFAALGPRAAEFMAVHDLDCHVGSRSPVGALYRSAATILLLGVGYNVCTALHLAEYDLPWLADKAYRCYVVVDGRRVLREFMAPELTADDFDELGAGLDGEPWVRIRTIGGAVCRALPVRDAVDFAARWMAANRTPVAPGGSAGRP